MIWVNFMKVGHKGDLVETLPALLVDVRAHGVYVDRTIVVNLDESLVYFVL